MSFYRNRYRVESTRLKGWDYTSEGWYFVTVCTRGHKSFFGKINEQRMRLSKIGKVALMYWEDIPNHSANTGLDAFVIMPNHLHGIVRINGLVTNDLCRDVACNVSTATTADIGACDAGDSKTTGGSGTLTVPPERGSLGAIVRSYKSAVTRWCQMHGYTSFAWQPRFYDHVIRDDAALHNVQRYILDNPAKWELDRDNLESRAYGRPG